MLTFKKEKKSMYNYGIITSSEEEKSLIKNLHSDLPEHIEMAEYEYN